MTNVLIRALTAHLLLNLVASQTPDISGLVRYTGNYENVSYQFSVRIPAGFVGLGAIPGGPNHGFRIYFSSDGSDWINAVADYDVLDLSKATPDYQNSAPAGFEVLETREQKSTLGGLVGRRIWQKIKRKDDGLIFITESVGAAREIRGETIAYSLGLQTPERNYQQRANMFNEMVKSFRLLP